MNPTTSLPAAASFGVPRCPRVPSRSVFGRISRRERIARYTVWFGRSPVESPLGALALLRPFVALVALAVLVSTAPRAQAEPLNSWTTISPSPSLTTANSLLYHAGKFIAPTNVGKIQYSSNGQNWTVVQTPATSYLTAIAYGNGRYVAVGYYMSILSSTDLQNWTMHETQPDRGFGRYYDVIFANGKFVAVGSGNDVRVSTNGIDWTAASMNMGTFVPQSIAWNGATYVAVGDTNLEYCVATSPDGLTWTKRKVDFTTGFVSVAYAKGTFVATGRSLIATSPDGVAWTKRTANYKYINTRTEVRFLNGRFVAYGQSGTLKSSPDGVSWTDHTPGSTGEISAIAYNGERALLFRGSTPAISAVWPLTDTPSEPPAPTDPGPGNPDEPSNPGNPSNPGDPSNPTPQNPSDPSDAKLVNMSTRAFVGTGSNVLVSGFYIDGTAPKKILVRGVGPTLAQFGLSGVVADPQLKVYDSAGQEIASNDNWSAQANAAEVAQASATAGAFALGNGSADAALVTTLAPGAYSAIISGVNSTTGIAIVEVYDLQPGNGSRLANLSSRTFVGTGAQVSIAGFYVAGTQPKTYLIRGIGPALTNFGVSGALPNPSINVVKSSGEPVTSNDNWGSFSDQAKLAAASASAGAFGLPAGSLDAALVVTLNPGAYSVLVDDTSGATGVSLVELYELK